MIINYQVTMALQLKYLKKINLLQQVLRGVIFNVMSLNFLIMVILNN